MERSPTVVDDNQCMTSSYHEINDVVEGEKSAGDTSDLELSLPGAKKLFNRAKNWVGDLSLEGVVAQEGQQVTYVAQDFAEKIKLSSPVKDVDSVDFPHDPSDLNSVINELEVEAKKLATSLDSVTENLSGILHSLSSMTLDCVFTASDGVTQLCDTADASIKVIRYHIATKCCSVF
ncbi:hypothetical protein Ocin01_03142 [Orchesella cincta]|uniref:BLOC-1-related complex subunit 6 C-terminal helix domain-containing protein n=1 Tax=Orchesella cincta TaxID=48709 RepID=A0A1D2NE45_ORCCI|nr:hypothetical protein Ocin01_03142 [Orchesella cincta]